MRDEKLVPLVPATPPAPALPPPELRWWPTSEFPPTPTVDNISSLPTGLSPADESDNERGPPSPKSVVDTVTDEDPTPGYRGTRRPPPDVVLEDADEMTRS